MAYNELLRADLPFDANAPRVARQLVREHVGGRVSSSALMNLELVVSELVTNAVTHGAPPAELILNGGDGALRVEVCDGSSTHPVLVEGHPAGRQGGRGLLIVSRLSHDWGWMTRDAGKCVWAATGNRTN